MALISDTPYEKHGGDDSGGDSLDFTPEKHHVAAVDNPKGGDPAGAKAAAQEVQETDAHESARAHYGASIAVANGQLKGDSMPFTESSGLFTSGPHVASEFDRAVRDSGGVRQGGSWCSDPAPGVHRSTVDHSLSLNDLRKPDEGQQGRFSGSGRTFESQRRARWVKD